MMKYSVVVFILLSLSLSNSTVLFGQGRISETAFLDENLNGEMDRGDFPDPSAGDNDSFENSYGPYYYSFNWGNVHFLVINDIQTVDPNENGSDYLPGIHPQDIGKAPSPGAVPLKEGPRVCTHLWYSQVPEGLVKRSSYFSGQGKITMS